MDFAALLAYNRFTNLYGGSHMKRFALLCALVASLGLVGCGGGGGGGGTTGAGTTNPVTVTGSIAMAEVNDAQLAAVRGATGAAIDYSKFTVGVGTTRVNPSQLGTFTLTFGTTSVNEVLDVQNSAGKALLRKRLAGVAAGGSFLGTTIDATSTAILQVLEQKPDLTETDLTGQGATLNGLVQTILTWLKTNTSKATAVTTDTTIVAVAGALTFLPHEKAVRDALTAMKTAMENNNLSSTERNAAFLTYVASNFQDLSGTPNYSDLSTTTSSRFDRYTINSYSFTVKNVRYIDASTIETETAIYIDVSRKPGATGGVSAAQINVQVGGGNPKLIWKLQTNGKWQIFSGLPYKSSEISI